MQHGSHPFDGPIRLWWGRVRGEPDPFLAAQAPTNLFQPIGPDQMFRAGGMVDETGRIADRDALQAMMARLVFRMDAEWERNAVADPRSGRKDLPDNEALPSGYAYFLQFIAHDMVDTVVTPTIRDGAVGGVFDNARARPLRLDTLYGAGPDECPHAYAMGGAQAESRGEIPRMFLRIGPSYPGRPGAFCPARDIARGTRPRSDYTGRVNLQTSALEPPQPATPDRQAISQGAKVQWDVLTEAQLADARNDSHALVSQLTVVFQLLHNHILNLLPTDGSDERRREEAYRRYLCARSITEMIYRRIIARDLLARILHPGVYGRYRDRKPLWTRCWRGTPLEFSFGAFRFAHSLVRDVYIVNSALETGDFGDALLQSRERKLSDKPMASSWMVDWVHFFDLGAPEGKLNFTKRIGPRYSKVLNGAAAFGANGSEDAPGLAARDLLSACAAGVLSVPGLTEKLKGVFNIIRDYQPFWPEKIRAWLRETGADAWPEAELQSLSSDPPLPFFVLFEAALLEDGKRLGPLGSAIVAETFFSALAQSSFDFESESDDLARSVETCATVMLDLESFAPASKLGGIDGMPALFRYMKAENLF